jgi:gamma-glutamyltranspeptidase/glutathione hydrolase
MNLHSAGHRRGVVCAPHAAAVEDGRAILAEGGNAIEAMLAMAASIAAVYPHMNHIGGDGFWLIREPSGRVRALMGAGRAGARATPRFYRDAGYDEIPARGPLQRSYRARSPPGCSLRCCEGTRRQAAA